MDDIYEQLTHVSSQELSEFIQRLKQLRLQKSRQEESQSLSDLEPRLCEYNFIPKKYSIPGVLRLALPVKISIFSLAQDPEDDWEFDEIDDEQQVIPQDIYERIEEEDFFDEYRSKKHKLNPIKWDYAQNLGDPHEGLVTVKGYLYWKQLPFPEYNPDLPPYTIEAVDANHIQGCKWTVYPDYVEAEDSTRITREEWPTALICVLWDENWSDEDD